jgi:hypothetical protein
MTNVVQFNSRGGNGRSPKNWLMHDSPKIENRTLENPVIQQGIRRQIDREDHPYLTRPEAVLFAFILTRTTDFGAEESRLTYRCIEKGDGLTAGIAMCRTQAKLHLHSLEMKGRVTVDRSEPNKGMLIRPNPYWQPRADTLTVRQEREARRATRRHELATRPPMPSPASTAVRFRQRPIDRTSKDPAMLERTFRRAFDEFYGDNPDASCPPWTDRHRHMISHALASPWGLYSAETCHDLLRWMVDWWPALAKLHGLPEYPDIEHIYRTRRGLSLEYEEHVRQNLWPTE